MKKLLLAFLTAAGTVSLARAGDFNVGFDGQKGAGGLTEAALSQLVQDLKGPPPPPAEYSCCGVSMKLWDVCLAVCPGELSSYVGNSFRQLAFYAAAQTEMKEKASAYFSAKGRMNLAAAFAAGKTVVSYEDLTVSLVFPDKFYAFNDEALAEALKKIGGTYGKGSIFSLIVPSKAADPCQLGPEECEVPPENQPKAAGRGDLDCLGPYGPQACPEDAPKSAGFARALSDLDCLGPNGPQPCQAQPTL